VTPTPAFSPIIEFLPKYRCSCRNSFRIFRFHPIRNISDSNPKHQRPEGESLKEYRYGFGDGEEDRRDFTG
jgi:hypothetical protein